MFFFACSSEGVVSLSFKKVTSLLIKFFLLQKKSCGFHRFILTSVGLGRNCRDNIERGRGEGWCVVGLERCHHQRGAAIGYAEVAWSFDVEAECGIEARAEADLSRCHPLVRM